MITLLIDLLLTAQIIVALLLVLVVLLQRPRSEGLGTAFASGMVEQYIGPATSVLVRFTTWMGGLFFVLTIALAFLYAHEHGTKLTIGQNRKAAESAAPAAIASTPGTSPAPVIVPASTAATAPVAVPGTSPAESLPPAASPATAAPVVPVPAATAPNAMASPPMAAPVRTIAAPPAVANPPTLATPPPAANANSTTDLLDPVRQVPVMSPAPAPAATP